MAPYLNPEKSTKANITEECFGGYHRCCLEKPFHLDYVSQSLCDILGWTAKEMHEKFHDKYSRMIIDEDRPRFLEVLDQLSQKEQTLTIEYRIQQKGGKILRFVDTITSRRLEDGKMYAFSTIVDVTDGKHAQINEDALREAQIVIPYGFLRCTCEKYPRVTHINSEMLRYLGVENDDDGWKEFLHENIFFMLPFEERDNFRKELQEASTRGVGRPLNVEHDLLRSDGTRIPLMGWISIVTNSQGEKEYAMIYMQMEYKHDSLQSIRENSYFRALESAFQVIFEINLTTNTVECIHGRETSHIGALYDVHMTIDSAKSFWINNYIVPDDQDMMKQFLDHITESPVDLGKEGNPSQVLQAEFCIKWTDHVIYPLTCVAVRLDASTVLLCCRDTSNKKRSTVQVREDRALERLSTWMEYVVTHDMGAYGMLALEEQDGHFSLLCASDKIREHLHIDENDYLTYVSSELPLSKCLETADISEHEFDELLRTGHLTINLFSRKEGTDKNLRLECKVYGDNTKMLYAITAYTNEAPVEKTPEMRIFARTFGHFDLFVNDVPVVFSSDKEKELMALLIDRNGGTLSTTEAIGYLWENEIADEKTCARYRKLAMGLKKTLVSYGIDHILINRNGVRSVDVTALKCDYYELLAGNIKYQKAFHNSYMTDYSWSEETLATLWNYS